jgi:hypothetical protein
MTCVARLMIIRILLATRQRRFIQRFPKMKKAGTSPTFFIFFMPGSKSL